ncbi:MAG: uracil-xanthine permease [Clostridia bacterium]|nr:uracil-xanthine permease [Clostridia bacterium]
MTNETKFGGKEFLLGFQHLFAMFGATVLVPALTGLNPLVALFAAGCGTLLFHLITKGKVPVFLGSSFAFIGGVAAVTGIGTEAGVTKEGIAIAGGGIICAGALYLVLALLARLIGMERIKSFFPPVVTGPIIMVIGLSLAPVAINGASGNWWIASFVVLVIIIVMLFTKGFFKLVPILIGIAAGYLLCIILKLTNVTDIVNLDLVAKADWFSFGQIFRGEFFILPKFEWTAITLIAPVAIVTFVEHIGDITTNGNVVGKNFLADPGLHRTLLGDGLATMFAGFIGGPANTTYSENTGVLAVTKNYNPATLRLAAVFAIVLSLVGKFGAVIQTIPGPVMGGVSIILFGIIASIGLRTIAQADLDFAHSRNLVIVALILGLGIGISAVGGIVIGSVTLSGLFVAAVVGIVLNKLLPKDI